MLALGGARGRGAAGQSSAHRRRGSQPLAPVDIHFVVAEFGSQLQKPAFLSRLSEEAIHWNSNELENSSGSGSWMRSEHAARKCEARRYQKQKGTLGRTCGEGVGGYRLRLGRRGLDVLEARVGQVLRRHRVEVRT